MSSYEVYKAVQDKAEATVYLGGAGSIQSWTTASNFESVPSSEDSQPIVFQELLARLSKCTAVRIATGVVSDARSPSRAAAPCTPISVTLHCPATWLEARMAGLIVQSQQHFSVLRRVAMPWALLINLLNRPLDLPCLWPSLAPPHKPWPPTVWVSYSELELTAISEEKLHASFLLPSLRPAR